MSYRDNTNIIHDIPGSNFPKNADMPHQYSFLRLNLYIAMGIEFELFNDSSTSSINFQKQSSPYRISRLPVHLFTDEETDAWKLK